MRAVWFDEFGARPEIRQVPDPVCSDDGVIIRVAATGLCRSDWHGWSGHDRTVALPHVPGHEFAGIVVEAGARVSDSLLGRRVCVPFICACGECPQCLAGEQQVCVRQTQPGFTGWGSFAELVAVEHADVNVLEIPDDLDFSAAAALGCRFATAYRALTVHGRPGPGDWIAVHGCGGVGLSVIMIAVAHGARVVGIDVSCDALALAAKFGAEAVIDASREDPVEAVRALTEGGAAVSVDALGSPATARNSILCLRPRGRHVQVGSMLAQAGPQLPMDRVLALELEIYGSHGMPAHAYPAMLAEVASGRVRPADLVSRHIGLDDAPTALMAMTGGSATGITIIHPASDPAEV